ncbi:hypothetical protein CIL05_02270 [Virgibacillus profundi]|uniref:HTH merR-type domain-containing protein n=1 Tax=Virgibacillus profundi TaxID=2024555 RepID=A0A2A2IIZ5_9BACI|nr:methyltransferase domain-containing protein [Virgibacillus profundi]PAV31502.1 hypothetical protein CIL05_02270 [Virgibacillus profundi]PXY55688.1 methyltransferase domain-containing protein [Virgibacillus profundi]
MHINEVAKQLNTTSRSIRFYEEKGLISPEKDEENNYRYFTEKDILRLSTILALREIGISVMDIKKILEDPKMSMEDYLNVQRSALFDKWIEIKDMIHAIDQMVEKTEDDHYSMDNILSLANHLKNLKNIRKNWQDKWNFDSWADDFDKNIKRIGHTFNVHQDYDEALAMIVDTVQLKQGETCLDIGIGTGNLGSKFLTEGIKVIGVDQSEKMLEMCKEKHPLIEVRKGNFLAIPLMDNHVDAVVSSYALHHLTDDEKLLALEEMRRVLKPNGQICIADLMFLNEDDREQVMGDFRKSGNTEAIVAIEDEYYADQLLLLNWLSEKGFEVKTHQFNDILGMIYAKKAKKDG